MGTFDSDMRVLAYSTALRTDLRLDTDSLALAAEASNGAKLSMLQREIILEQIHDYAGRLLQEDTDVQFVISLIQF